MQKIALVILFLAVTVGLGLFLMIPRNLEAQAPSQRDLCERDPLGNWQEFSNGCGDSCEFVRNPQTTFCTQAFTYACNCDPDSCWNGTACEPIISTAPIFSKADFNKDGKVDGKDYDFLKERFYKTDRDALQADLNQDQKVNLLDYAILVIEWTR